MSQKLKTTRLVTFEEDYTAGGMLIYKKDSEHAIHFKTADMLKGQGVKMKIKKVDIEAANEKAKIAFEKAAKEEAKEA